MRALLCVAWKRVAWKRAAWKRVAAKHVAPSRVSRTHVARLGVALLLGCALPVGALLPGCALPPAVTPEDPPLIDADDKPPLQPGGLTPEQNQRLLSGGRVEELMELDRQGQHYVGGVSYTLVRAEPRQVFEVLNQLATLSQVLPSTRSTRIIDRTGNRVRVELEQGNSVVSTTFTVFFQLEPPEADNDPHVVRFWLDPSQPHSINDAWGFFRATRYDAEHSLVSVGALVNVGPGVIRMLFEQRIQRAIMRMPKRIRDTVERTYRVAPTESVSSNGP
jgi:ribosome-associated toxin RatA of RatAB toxin-antitoxin module